MRQELKKQQLKTSNVDWLWFGVYYFFLSPIAIAALAMIKWIAESHMGGSPYGWWFVWLPITLPLGIMALWMAWKATKGLIRWLLWIPGQTLKEWSEYAKRLSRWADKQ